MIDPINYMRLAQQCNQDFISLKRNTQKLLTAYNTAVREYDDLKLKYNELRIKLDEMSK